MNGDNYEVSHDTIRREMLCACPFDGNSKWHRVQIVTCRGTAGIKVSHHGILDYFIDRLVTFFCTSQVRFIDYGTVAEVSITKLRYLHLDFARLPTMCIRTKLKGVKAKVNESQKPGYSVDVTQTFFEFINVNDLEAEIVSADLVVSDRWHL